MLSVLVHGRDGEGSGLSDQEIRDQVVTLIAAGYETTSAAMGWALYCVGAEPDLQRRLQAEIAAATGGESPTPESLTRMPLLRGVVSETLRL